MLMKHDWIIWTGTGSLHRTATLSTWRQETKDGIVYGTCKYCGTVIKMGVSGGYDGPEKHLRSRHPVEYAKYAAKKKERQEVQTQISRFANRAVEREFSAGGNILTDFRSCLNAESLETLVCNQDWLLARRRAQESGYEFNSEHYMNATTDGSPSFEE
ncbi:hypothetical protein DM860_011481 [Cuscuta australis]|uniref:HAT C-terminal dimerisation domain-containing protein n=1 Tax=Cuscuta australis TaxID=267555 RepID=A0A328CZT3_9ASTE|nr:hypothetical protein DM860_011481 [Cuscuta australis]